MLGAISSNVAPFCVRSQNAPIVVRLVGQTVVDNLFGSEDPISLQTTFGSATPGARITFRDESPKVPTAGCTKRAALNQCMGAFLERR